MTAEDLAGSSAIPVINAFSDRFHPCQALTDFFTLRERTGDLSKLTIAFIGCVTNICRSLILAAARSGSRIQIASPQGFQPEPEILEAAEDFGKESGFSYYLTDDPMEAADNADVIYTEPWPLEGPVAQKKQNVGTLASYQVNQALMGKAKPEAAFLHPLPVNRGKEVSSDVVDSNTSLVFEQAENRLHMHKAIMLSLLETRI